MIQNVLEILIITYNRSGFLEKTLQCLSQCAFVDCKITILDNCSSDNTPQICEKYRMSFPRYFVHRHRINIGGNPNYLRAIELSKSTYTWILCDDDYLNFTDIDDVIEAVDREEYDLIEVGAIERRPWPRGTVTSVRQLVEMKVGYHFGMSFFPTYIFKTALFDSDNFCWGYKNIDLLYPQFGFLNKSVREDFSIYIARKKIVTRNDVNDHSLFPFAWYAAWVACCRTIEEEKVRAQAIDDATSNRGFFKCVIFWTAFDRKSNNDGEFWSRVAVVLRTLSGRQKLKFLLALSPAFLPAPLTFWVWVRQIIYKIKRVPQDEIPPLNFVKRG